MTGKMLLLSALLVGAATIVNSMVDSTASAKAYLMKYGYMNGDNDDGMVSALRQFQYMANIPDTGMLDVATMNMMNMSRCGVVDNMGPDEDAVRKRRYTLGSQGRIFTWRSTDLTYRIDSRTPDIPNTADVDSTMEDALKVWSDVTPLTFTRVYGNTAADIIITFVSGNHGDGNAFDGPGSVLAHAYFPENGDAHFDEDEPWTINSFQGINLFQVAAHEFGHSLGLGHSTDEAALMAPFYRGFVQNFRLHSDDIAGIRALYGENAGMPEGTMRPDPEIPTGGGCTGVVDAITSTQDGSTYIFEGSNVWRRELGRNRIAAGFPKPIRTVFPGLPDNIDAALFVASEGTSVGVTYFFKGSEYWSFRNEVPEAGNPRNIGDDWINLPDDLDAAFVWSGNNRIYFVKGTQYYRYSLTRSSVDRLYPRSLSVWNIPGDQVSAASQWMENSRTYFFTEEGGYYRFSDVNFDVEPNYPRPVSSTWQGCINRNIEAVTEPSGVNGLVPSLLVLMSSLVVGVLRL